MILVDTSVWIDHLRKGDAELARTLEAGDVLTHPFIIGELACGNLTRRTPILGLLRTLPAAQVATDDEVLGFIERRKLMGRGMGYIDAHLLASIALTRGSRLWTRDKRLAAVASHVARN